MKNNCFLYSVLFVSLLSFSGYLYSMEEEQGSGKESTCEKFENSAWGKLVQQALSKYNEENNTKHTFADIAHIKRNGLYWPSRNDYENRWFLAGYDNGHYMNINQWIAHRNMPRHKEIDEKHIKHFLTLSPQITVEKSYGTYHAEGKKENIVKVTIDTSALEQDLENRKPWYKKTGNAYALGIACGSIATLAVLKMVNYFSK